MSWGRWNVQRRPAALLALGIAGLTACLRTARATEADVVVAVDCPAYEPEARAAVEARARAELIVRGATGTLVVSCRQASAELTWHPLAGHSVRTTVSLAPDRRAAIDGILEGLDTLLTTPPSPGEGTPDTTGAAVAPPPAVPPPPAQKPEPTQPRAPAPPDEARASTARHEPDGERSGFRGIVLAAGAHGELWSRSEALGPSARVEVLLPLRFAVSADATALWALRSPEGVNTRVIRPALAGAFGIDARERFRIGLEAFLDLVHADANGAGADDKVVGGVLLQASAALPVGPVRLEVGPTLAIHPQEVQVRIGDTEALHMPRFTVGMSLTTAVGPLR